jgi:uncharacterized membrane protein
MKHKLASRKLWTAIITAVAMLVAALTGIELDTEQILAVILPVIAYIFGEAWVDALRIPRSGE